MIVSIDDIVFFFVHMISLMTIALMCIQIDNQKSLKVVPLFHVTSDKCDIRVDTETSTIGTVSMMVPAREINGPTLVSSDASAVN